MDAPAWLPSPEHPLLDVVQRFLRLDHASVLPGSLVLHGALGAHRLEAALPDGPGGGLAVAVYDHPSGRFLYGFYRDPSGQIVGPYYRG